MTKKLFLTALLTVLVVPFAMNAQDNQRDMWDFITSFATSTGRQHGVVYDGEYIYTSAWGKSSTVLSMFYKYDFDGNLIEEFDVAGVNNSDNYMRDMTYDGQYFYGCDAHSGTIWCYDLHNKTLVNSNNISTSFSELGHCTYDPVYDAFWVGERAAGSSPNLYLDLKLVNRSGVVIKTATSFNIGTHTIHGTGHFTDENNVAHLYLFAVEGFSAHVYDYNIDDDTMSSDIIFDFSVTPGWGPGSSAGGAFIGEHEGTICFFGDVDKSPNLIGIYALSDYTPVIPTPPEGDIFFDFEDGIMHWTTIDGDGDGFDWVMRQIWGDPNGNHYCVTSASYDDPTQTVLFPENYLVTPYKLDCEQIILKASVQDISHPYEHFGVAVSTESNTIADDFTIIWETEMSAKTAGNWYLFDIDLREYQGQDIYVAVVHFNCTNQFMLNIDDITLNRIYDNSGNDVPENKVQHYAIYPNPADNVVCIDGDKAIESYELYNASGALVCSGLADNSSLSIDISGFPAGVYFIKTTSEGMTQTMRIVKK